MLSSLHFLKGQWTNRACSGTSPAMFSIKRGLNITQSNQSEILKSFNSWFVGCCCGDEMHSLWKGMACIIGSAVFLNSSTFNLSLIFRTAPLMWIDTGIICNLIIIRQLYSVAHNLKQLFILCVCETLDLFLRLVIISTSSFFFFLMSYHNHKA